MLYLTVSLNLAPFDMGYYYPVDISTTVFSYSRAVQYHTILHGVGVIARGPGAMRYPSNHDVL